MTAIVNTCTVGVLLLWAVTSHAQPIREADPHHQHHSAEDQGGGGGGGGVGGLWVVWLVFWCGVVFGGFCKLVE
jgi:hypothetical protein